MVGDQGTPGGRDRWGGVMGVIWGRGGEVCIQPISALKEVPIQQSQNTSNNQLLKMGFAWRANRSHHPREFFSMCFDFVE